MEDGSVTVITQLRGRFSPIDCLVKKLKYFLFDGDNFCCLLLFFHRYSQYIVFSCFKDFPTCYIRRIFNSWQINLCKERFGDVFLFLLWSTE